MEGVGWTELDVNRCWWMESNIWNRMLIDVRWNYDERRQVATLMELQWNVTDCDKLRWMARDVGRNYDK
jgi:hypothetical protein